MTPENTRRAEALLLQKIETLRAQGYGSGVMAAAADMLAFKLREEQTGAIFSALQSVVRANVGAGLISHEDQLAQIDSLCAPTPATGPDASVLAPRKEAKTKPEPKVATTPETEQPAT